MMVMVDGLDPPRHVDDDPAGSNDGRVRRCVLLTSEGTRGVNEQCKPCLLFFFFF